jgi:hypothetical protein
MSLMAVEELVHQDLHAQQQPLNQSIKKMLVHLNKHLASEI